MGGSGGCCRRYGGRSNRGFGFGGVMVALIAAAGVRQVRLVASIVIAALLIVVELVLEKKIGREREGKGGGERELLRAGR